jgi:hypothetical protein
VPLVLAIDGAPVGEAVAWAVIGQLGKRSCGANKGGANPGSMVREYSRSR